MSTKRNPPGYWNYERCKEEASKYKTRYELYKTTGNAYEISRKNGWLDEFFPKS